MNYKYELKGVEKIQIVCALLGCVAVSFGQFFCSRAILCAMFSSNDLMMMEIFSVSILSQPNNLQCVCSTSFF